MTTTLDHLITDCRSALAEGTPQTAMREVLQRAVSSPADLTEALPAPRQQMTVVHLSSELSILQLVNGPGFVFHPHDHGS